MRERDVECSATPCSHVGGTLLPGGVPSVCAQRWTNLVRGREGILWIEVDEGRWEGSSGPLLVGVVSWDGGYAVRSSGGEVRGKHSTLDSAKAQLEGWMRWLDSTDAD